LPPEAHPVAAIYGRTSKIKRYYWREFFKREMEVFGEWALANGVDPLLASGSEAECARKQASIQALDEIKRTHETAPKYSFKAEQTLPELVAECEVEVVSLQGVYVKDVSTREAQIQWKGHAVAVEEFVSLHYQQEGYECLEVESVPFHVLFGVYLWLLIQDLEDERVQIVGFGDRFAFDNGEKGHTIWCHKPADFGSTGYAKRRKDAIDRHFAEMLQSEELDWLFDYWLEPSQRLRQYLWAHRPTDIEKAKKLITILPQETLLRVLRYLADSYWERYLGWPDLLLFRNGDYFFAEVKSSNDQLSNEQKRWIRDNHAMLKLPFKLVKIHKTSVVSG
jgi:hypothetical protein